MKRTNIIFFMTDQHRWDCIGAFNKQIKTPNLDRLASRGILFKQAVCQCPMCVPSRNSMMHGLYPSQLGVRSNGDGFVLEDRVPLPALPQILHKEGYQTAGFGKTHWSHYHKTLNPKPTTKGFEYRVHGPVLAGGYEDGMITMQDVDPEGFKAFLKEMEPFGLGGEDSSGYIGCTSKIPQNQHLDGFIAEQCLDFLDHGTDQSRPLFLYVSFSSPHAGFSVPEAYENMYHIEDIPDIEQPEWLEEPETHLSALYRQSEFLLARHMERKNAWEKLGKADRRRSTLRYWAYISWLDGYIGRITDKLEEKGLLEDSLILFTSDHGEMMGDRRHTFTKYCLYDGSVRVPLLLSGTAVPDGKKGSIDERPVELVDIMPTILGAAKIPANPMLPGMNLLGDEKKTGSFCELHGGGQFDEEPQPAPAYMWRNAKWKLVLYLPGTIVDAASRVGEAKGELYDLELDPHEWHNLYACPETRDVREQMKTELLMYLASAWAKAPFFCYKGGFNRLMESK